MRKFLLFLTCILSMQVMAQEEKLHLTFNVGDPMNFNVNDIKDITFVEDSNPMDIIGEWFNEAVEEYGTYESFEFRDDGTLTYCPYYLNYHDGYTLPGYYLFEDYMLTMQIGGIGTFSRSVTSHSSTSFVITASGANSTYYKVQGVYKMKTDDEPINIGGENDIVTFVDNEHVGLDNNKIKALKAGAGYALVKDSKLNTTVAYRIDVELVLHDWTQYFKKTKEEITSVFGEPYTEQSTETMDVYIYFSDDPAFSILYFCFDKESGKMNRFQGVFSDENAMEAYKKGIENKYLYQEDISTKTVSYYYDTEDPSSLSTAIAIQSSLSNMTINYWDLK